MFAGMLALSGSFDYQAEREGELWNDHVYLYTAGLYMADREAVEARYRVIRQFEEQHGFSESERRSFAVRERLTGNYPMASALMLGVSRLVGGFEPGATSQYADDFHRRVNAGFTASYVLAAVALTFILAASGVWAASAASAALCLIIALETLLPEGGVYRVGDWSEPMKVFSQLIALFLNGKPYLTPFGLTPRDWMLLLLFGVGALRLAGRYTAGYWILAALLPLHLIYAILVLAVVATVDILVRPWLFLERGNKIPFAVAVALAIVFGRDVLFFLNTPVLFLLIAVAVTALFFQPVSLVVNRLHERTVRRWVPRNGALADICALLFVFAVALILSALFNKSADRQTANYFWLELPSRVMGIEKPLLLVTAAGLAMTYARSILKPSLAALLVPVTAIGTLAIALAQDYRTWTSSTSLWGPHDMVRQLDKDTVSFKPKYAYDPTGKVHAFYHDVIMFYAINKEIDTGTIVLEQALQQIQHARNGETATLPSSDSK